MEGKLMVKDLVHLLEFILKNNHPAFEDKIYNQKLGTPIGTKFVTSTANKLILILEENMLNEYRLDSLVWWSSLDYLFLIWL